MHANYITHSGVNIGGREASASLKFFCGVAMLLLLQTTFKFIQICLFNHLLNVQNYAYSSYYIDG